MEGESVYKEIEELVKEQEQQLNRQTQEHQQFDGIHFCDQPQISFAEDQLDHEHVNNTRIIEDHVDQVMRDQATADARDSADSAIPHPSSEEPADPPETIIKTEDIQMSDFSQPQNIQTDVEQQSASADNETAEANEDNNDVPETTKDEVALEICRVCLSDDKENLQCIFSGGVSEQVRTVAAVDLDRDDGLPQFICFDCRQDLAIAVKFKTKCENSDTELRNKLGIKMKTVVKTELVLLDCDDVQIISDGENQNKKKHEASTDDEYQENFYRSDDPDFNIDEEEEELLLPRKKKVTPKRSKKNRDSFKAAINDNVEITINKSSDGSYPCPFCFRAFPYPSTLKLHLPTHRNKISKCVLCAATFVSQKELYDHYKNAHPKECSKAQSKTLTCDICNMKFTSKSSLKAHEATHVGVNKYKCQKCPQSFNNLTSLNLHKRQDHYVLKKPYQCKVCEKRFKHTSSLEKHMENHKYTQKIKLPPQKVDTERKPMSTKDLFKSIAPVTTTYWSDSFSD